MEFSVSSQDVMTPHTPPPHPRNILLCTVGGSPAVVTETLWALLYDRDTPWAPDRIEIVGTAFALESVRTELMRPDGRLATLYGTARHPGPIPPIAYYAPPEEGGSSRASAVLEWPGGAAPTPAQASAMVMQDVTTAQHSAAMFDLIKNRIWAHARDAATSLHVSIAGGRKTMSAHAMLALSLLGRAQDEMSHVLVHARDGEENLFENNKHFWHPLQGGGPIATFKAGVTVDPARAVVRLVDAPVAFASDIDLKPAAIAKLSLDDIARQLRLGRLVRTRPTLRLDVRDRSVTLCGVRATLEPRMFFDLAALAYARKENWSAPDRPKDQGGISAAILLHGGEGNFELVERRLAPLWWRLRSKMNLRDTNEPVLDRDGAGVKNLEKAREGRLEQPFCVKLANGLVKEFRAFNRLREALTNAFGKGVAAQILPPGSGERAAAGGLQVSFAALALPPEAIAISDDL